MILIIHDVRAKTKQRFNISVTSSRGTFISASEERVNDSYHSRRPSEDETKVQYLRASPDGPLFKPFLIPPVVNKLWNN